MMEAICNNCDCWQHNGGPLNVGYCRQNKMAYRKASQTCDKFIHIVAKQVIGKHPLVSFIAIRHDQAGWYGVSVIHAISFDLPSNTATDALVKYDTSEAAIKATVKEILGAIGEFSVEDAKDIRMLCDTALTPTLF